MLNVNAITSTLAKLPDAALQKYAAMHKDDPYIMALAMAESNRRKQMRNAAQAPQDMPEPPKVVDQGIAAMAPQAPMPQSPEPQMPQQLPEDVGIGQLPAGDMNFADGGIIAFGDGGDVEHYVKGGNTADKVEAFKKRYGALAEETGKRIGVDSNILLAQWALETDYGKRTVGANNLGNIKDLSGKGPKAFDKLEKSNSSYRSYDSPKEFGNDFAGLIERRYPDAKGAGADLNKYVAGMKGYATDKDYGKKLAATLTKFIPIGSANAEPAPPRSTTPTISAPTPTREQMLAQIPGTSRPPAPAPVAASALEALAGEMYPSSVGAAFVPPKSGIRKKPEAPPAPAPAPAPASAAGLPALTREQMIAQIPGQDGRPVTAQPSRAEPPRTLGDYATSPFQTLYSMAHNTAALPIAGADVVARRLAGEVDPSLELDKFFYIPKNPVAQQQLGTISGVMQDLKIPPYLSTIGGVRGPRPPAPQAAQDMAKVEALRLPPPASPTPAAAKVAAPRLSSPETKLANVSPEGQGILRIHPDRAAALEERRLAMLRADRVDAADEAADVADAARRRVDNLAADKAQAARAAQYANERNANIANARAVNEALPGPTNRLGLTGIAGIAAEAGVGELPAAGAAPTGIGPGDPGWGADLGQQIVPSDLSKDEKKEIVSAAKETGAKPPKGEKWTGDDWLALGLNLMATKSPRFLQAVGEAGIGALKSRQERLQTERKTENEAIENAYRQAGTKKLVAETADLTSDSAKTKQALAAADTMYDNWLNRVKANPVDAINIDQAAADAQYRTFLKRAFGAYNMQVPAGLATSGLTQLSPADLALIERYNKTKP